MPRKYTDAERVEAFWSKVNKDGPTQPHMSTPCWIWTGSRDGGGYGRFGIEGRLWAAHRLAWCNMNTRRLRSKLDVIHECDTPSCVNPEHLRQATTLENVQDMDRKGRRVPPRGEAHGRVKLTECAVREIRARTGVSAAELAKEYGVARTTVGKVIAGETWKHIP